MLTQYFFCNNIYDFFWNSFMSYPKFTRKTVVSTLLFLDVMVQFTISLPTSIPPIQCFLDHS